MDERGRILTFLLRFLLLHLPSQPLAQPLSLLSCINITIILARVWKHFWTIHISSTLVSWSDSSSDASSLCLFLLEPNSAPIRLCSWHAVYCVAEREGSAKAGTVLILLPGDHQMLSDSLVDAVVELLLQDILDIIRQSTGLHPFVTLNSQAYSQSVVTDCISLQLKQNWCHLLKQFQLNCFYCPEEIKLRDFQKLKKM